MEGGGSARDHVTPSRASAQASEGMRRSHTRHGGMGAAVGLRVGVSACV